MIETGNILYRTNYFKRQWTWIRRISAMSILGIGVLFLPIFVELEYLKLVIFGLIVIYFTTKPKDDLAVTNEQLLHIKQSVISKLTRIDSYKISELTSIRCGGVHTDGWELVDFFNGGGNTGGYNNIVEMSFQNGESTSLELAIDRKKLDKIVKLIYNLKKTKPNRVARREP